jgi:hypothetical protein
LFLPLLAYPKLRTVFPEERDDDEDTPMKYDDCTCLNWKEILNLIDDYYKVNSFLVDSNAWIYENVILPKSMHLCMIWFEGETSIAREGEEQQEELDTKTTHECARGEREACATQEEFKISSDSVWTNRSSDYATDTVSSYELRIKQISTRWKDNFKNFPINMPQPLPAKEGGHCWPFKGGSAG